MSYYEYVFMLRGDLSSSQVEDISKKYQENIEKLGGKVTKDEYWGLRNLAYKIKKNKKAHYCLFNLDIAPDGLKEIQRSMTVNESILRYLAIKVDALDNTPSLMMRKSSSRGAMSQGESNINKTNL